MSRHWLLKAEPDSRIVKGKDVKFSVDDFERDKTTSWNGVRNHVAKNYLRDQIKLDQECLFYASDTKVPGVTALCRVSKEGYPDSSAWDPDDPYYDPKSDESKPTWYMVDVDFVRRLPNMVPLKLLQTLAAAGPQVPECVKDYVTKDDLRAISEMPLLNRGRLSVQPVSDEAYDVVVRLGDRGGWQEWFQDAVKGGNKKKTTTQSASKKKGKSTSDDEEQDKKASSSKRRKTTK